MVRTASIPGTDVTFSDKPPRASVLAMRQCPALGGDTLWSNQYLAYENPSAPLQRFLTDLTAVHTAASFGKPEIRAAHPAVITHPETGRESLFRNRTFTSSFVELSEDESRPLLSYSFAWSEKPDFQCRHRWSEGDVAMWDNRVTQHVATSDISDRRIIHRVTALGEAPQ